MAESESPARRSHAPNWGWMCGYAHLLVLIAWLVAMALIVLLAGIWLDTSLGRASLYPFMMDTFSKPLYGTYSAWQARMLASVCLPSFALSAAGPLALRIGHHTSRLAALILGLGMLLATLMVCGNAWQITFHGQRSGTGAIDAIGALRLDRFLPASVYTPSSALLAAVAFCGVAALITLARSAIPTPLLPDRNAKLYDPLAAAAAIDAWIASELSDNLNAASKRMESSAGAGEFQATGYRIFAAGSTGATAALPSSTPASATAAPPALSGGVHVTDDSGATTGGYAAYFADFTYLLESGAEAGSETGANDAYDEAGRSNGHMPPAHDFR